MSIRDGDRLPHRRILTGSDLMKCDDRISEKRYKDRKSTRLNSSHSGQSRMPSSA